jgi:processive 1,2-diacylglycerol beta-glucosyltransferase
MKKVLFFPLLRIPSGHHQVANTLIDSIKAIDNNIICEKIELLSTSYGRVESLISNIYLTWIHRLPSLYRSLYQWNAVNNRSKVSNSHKLYIILFLSHLRKVLRENDADLLVCTHAMPSFLLNHLKEHNEISVPIINVYTDYFINNIWGSTKIDYHFVPDQILKDELVSKGVPSEKINITGIPVHSELQNENGRRHPTRTRKILVTGGSLGCGVMKKLIMKIESDEQFQWFVLCGKNSKLFDEIKNKEKKHLHALPYISSKVEMADLYNEVDAILTKPGGVTLSESITRKIPIFVYYALPGQEEMNFQHLEKLKIVYPIYLDKPIGRQLENFFEGEEVSKFQSRIANYLYQQIDRDYSYILKKLIQ